MRVAFSHEFVDVQDLPGAMRAYRQVRESQKLAVLLVVVSPHTCSVFKEHVQHYCLAGLQQSPVIAPRLYLAGCSWAAAGHTSCAQQALESALDCVQQ
jgi:hypothetical protein